MVAVWAIHSFKLLTVFVFAFLKATRTSPTDSQLRLGGAFHLTPRGVSSYGPEPRRRKQAGGGLRSLPVPAGVPRVSELHQTAKRAHHEASSFTLCGASSSWLLVQGKGQGGPAATQHRRQKLNGTVAGLTHDRRVDCETIGARTQLLNCWSLSHLAWHSLTS